MNHLDKQYKELLETILRFGIDKKDRTGTGTKSIFGYTIRHNMKDGFPLLTTKKMAWKQIVTELLWFLKGDTNIKFLLDNDTSIWNGDAYKNYKLKRNFQINQGVDILSQEEFVNKIKTNDEFAKKWGELGPVYGKQWRSWGRKNVTNYDLKDVKGSDQHRVLKAIENGEDITKYGVKIEYQNNSIDQIQNLINELKTNPDSRRLMVSAWNVGELDQMVLPPCHYGFQVYTRELSDEEKMQWYSKEHGENIDKVRNYFEPVNLTVPFKTLDGETINFPQRAISLMYNARSQDVPLGTPFNIASYALLLEIIAKEVNMVPDELITNMGDCHIYLNQIEGVKEQLAREPYSLPTLKINTEFWQTQSGECGVGLLKTDLRGFEISDFTIEGYQSHPAIKIPLSN